MDINSIKVDSAVIEVGEWVRKIPEMGDLGLKVRGEGNEDFKRFLNRKLRNVPKGARHRDGTVPPALMESIIGEALLETVLIDWANLKNGDEDVPYSKELARTFLTDKDYRHFRTAVQWAASFVAGGQEFADEDEGGAQGEAEYPFPTSSPQ
ncbi:MULTISPECIES: hypothetical protein [unclassified Chelatococcus]|uniref:hypothetical protein n=1 Tax=unclassified Chelatococcus TaxID=2638111 RepID=UPI001BCB5459|nr:MULTISPECIES: hypothetical protein [unclassified Chelatococcus]MBS7737940.1 hypothetical protein [Chelatococcus sp. HY11]MCO5077091.1 Lrp/AsnC ligand binding domain-containing protein [Chelatococcus sp.]